MKTIRLIVYLLCLIQTTTVYAGFSRIDFPEESPYLISTCTREPGWPIEQRCYAYLDIPQLINQYAGEIAEYCDFDPGQPVLVPLDSNQLLHWLDDRGIIYLWEREHKQILLLGAEYHIDRPVRISTRHSVICGIRQWLKAKEPEIFEQLTLAFPQLRPTTDHSGGESADGAGDSGSGAEALLPELFSSDSDGDRMASLHDPEDDRVKLFFQTDGSHYPSMVTFAFIRFRHLRMYRVGQLGGAGLMTAACNHRKYYCPDYLYWGGSIALYNTHVEDLTGHSDFLVRLDDRARLIVKNSTFNFLHKNSNSKVFEINRSLSVNMDNVTIHNNGPHGTAIFLDGIDYMRPEWKFSVLPFILGRINITAAAGASITGLSFQDGRPPLQKHQLPQLTGFTFGEGVATGFNFPDHSVFIREEGNTGNRMENPEGVHCIGAPLSGKISFTDGTTCFAAPSSSPVPTPASIPEPVVSSYPAVSTLSEPVVSLHSGAPSSEPVASFHSGAPSIASAAAVTCIAATLTATAATLITTSATPTITAAALTATAAALTTTATALTATSCNARD